MYGAEREVCFAREHPQGRLGLLDFTVCDAFRAIVYVGVTELREAYSGKKEHSPTKCSRRKAERCDFTTAARYGIILIQLSNESFERLRLHGATTSLPRIQTDLCKDGGRRTGLHSWRL